MSDVMHRWLRERPRQALLREKILCVEKSWRTIYSMAVERSDLAEKVERRRRKCLIKESSPSSAPDQTHA